MPQEVAALGPAFSDWSQLTEVYVQEMEALRRQEPGSSVRMMEIARRMNHYRRLLRGPHVEPAFEVNVVEKAQPSHAGR